MRLPLAFRCLRLACRSRFSRSLSRLLSPLCSNRLFSSRARSSLLRLLLLPLPLLPLLSLEPLPQPRLFPKPRQRLLLARTRLRCPSQCPCLGDLTCRPRSPRSLPASNRQLRRRRTFAPRSLSRQLPQRR
jgi:hypothetical protein